MNKQEKEDLIAKALQTTYGKNKFRQVFQYSCTIAADKFQEGSIGWILGRMLAGLPPDQPKHSSNKRKYEKN